MLRPLYDRLIELSRSERAPYVLAAVAFAESSFFPLPPDIMLIPMTVAAPGKAWRYACICTVSSVMGGLLGYAIGALLYDTVGQWIIRVYGMGANIEAFRDWYKTYGAAVILIKGVSPIPYKLVTIASGIAGYSLFWFVVLSTLTRGARFFIEAGVLNRFGDPVRNFIERNLTAVAVGSLILIVGGFILALKLH
jgi:membrane protein YqaA with SNARE-associated domain